MCIDSERSAFQCAPILRHADKMQDKGFLPACLFQWLDLLADMTDEIEIEVLQLFCCVETIRLD